MLENISNMNYEDKIKIKNFDNMLKDFHEFVAPYAKSKGWFTHYSENNYIPQHLSDNADYSGHNPIQVLFCLALNCKDWDEVCKKTDNICLSVFGKKTNL